ncbi:MAG: hypothetical protein MI756_18325, partial [Chromatiales bacterium]|nr:hypothetical protein [Chromatiales bacterium]
MDLPKEGYSEVLALEAGIYLDIRVDGSIPFTKLSLRKAGDLVSQGFPDGLERSPRLVYGSENDDQYTLVIDHVEGVDSLSITRVVASRPNTTQRNISSAAKAMDKARALSKEKHDGHWRQGAEEWQRAAEMWARLQDAYTQSYCLGRAGFFLENEGLYREAVNPYLSAADIFEDLQDWDSYAMALINVAKAYLELSDFEQARAFATKAI